MAELIVALDVNNRKEAVEKINLIGPDVGFYKMSVGFCIFSNNFLHNIL